MDNGVHSTSFRTTPKTILDAYRGRTILVTGGRGFIGSALTQSLSDINCKLILLDESPAGVWRPTGQQAEVLIQQGDVAVRKTWEMVLSGVDTVFHLAAREYHYRTEYDPERDLTFNALPTLHLLEVCRSQQYRPQIVFASSANVFGVAASLPVNEDTHDDPLTMWAIHKLAAEQYFRLYAQQFGISTITLRLANAYGPTARRAVMTRMVINNMIAKALEGKALTTYVNRGCKRDFVFLEDVVQAFLLAGQHGGIATSPMYVIGGGEDKTIEEVWHLIAQTIGTHTGQDIPVGCDESVEIEPVEWRHFTADTARFRCDTGWEPKTTLTQGIDITVRTFLSDSRQFT
jgi:UDP-glucose 4-epimerase